jgi:hypothetical protein
MRRIALAGLVLAAALTALPASARIFRTDLNRCDEPDSFATVCWDGSPPAGAIPPLPINGETSFLSTDGLLSAEFSTSSFDLVAFDYASFVADNQAFFQSHNIAVPFLVISHGLSRPDAGPSGSDFQSTDNPLLRLNWFFDVALLPTFGNLFEDVQTINGVDYFGVQLIFDGQGFELNGLKAAGMAYSHSTADGQDLWSGADQPCDAFNNAGVCIAAVPEPSSIALFGFALLALVVGVRTRKPARVHLA